MPSRNLTKDGQATHKVQLYAKPMGWSLLASCFFWTSLSVYAGNWKDHKVESVTKQAKFRQVESNLVHLINEKKRTKDPVRARQIVGEMSTLYQELSKVYESYKEEQQHMRFHHPEKGDNDERHYLPQRLRSLDEMESDLGLDGQLTRIQGKIRRIYNLSEEELSKKSGTKRVHQQPKEKDKEGALKLVK